MQVIKAQQPTIKYDSKKRWFINTKCPWDFKKATNFCEKNGIQMWKRSFLPWSRIESVIAVAVVLTAHDGILAAKSLQSDKFKSRLSNVEKLLRDDSQLRFWLKLFEWKLVTTPLDELLLAYEFNRWMGAGIVEVCIISSISPWSVSQPSSVLELYCCRIWVCRCVGGTTGSGSVVVVMVVAPFVAVGVDAVAGWVGGSSLGGWVVSLIDKSLYVE